MGNFMNPDAPARSVVVVGIDFSDNSLAALRTAESWTRSATNSELHLVHALAAMAPPLVTAEVAATSETSLAETPETAAAKLELLVRRIAPTAEDLGRVIGHLRLGDPVTSIVQLASDVSADLIVVGTHGRTGFDRLMFGSVAEKVVRVAPCPVLTVRPKAVALWERIEPPCPQCVAVQQQTNRAQWWCEVHSQRHPRAHTYYEYPPSFGMGSQSFRTG